MVLYAEALQKIIRAQDHTRPLKTEWLPVEKAIGRIVAETIRSAENVPAFDNSAMDGFVVPFEKTLNTSDENPIEFKIVGELAAGDWVDGVQIHECLDRNVAFEIMTGAPVPEKYFNAVIKVEEIERIADPLGGEKIKIRRPLKCLENIRSAGTDIQKEQILFNHGVQFTSEMILAATACGITQIPVFAPLKVALLSTGSELVDFETPVLPMGKIRNSTGPYLKHMLSKMGCEVEDYGIVADDPNGYLAVFESVRKSDFDLILTTGAVSMGKYDFIIPTLADLKAKIHFHKVAIRPGKPIVFAEVPRVDGGGVVPFFGMPGNPVSTAVALRFFVQPFLRAKLGLPEEKRELATLVNDVRKPEGLKCFFKAKLSSAEGENRIEVLAQQGSYMVGNFAETKAWVVLPEEGDRVEKGQRIEFVRFGGEIC